MSFKHVEKKKFMSRFYHTLHTFLAWERQLYLIYYLAGRFVSWEDDLSPPAMPKCHKFDVKISILAKNSLETSYNSMIAPIKVRL